jgi:hypothetical protein
LSFNFAGFSEESFTTGFAGESYKMGLFSIFLRLYPAFGTISQIVSGLSYSVTVQSYGFPADLTESGFTSALAGYLPDSLP